MLRRDRRFLQLVNAVFHNLQTTTHTATYMRLTALARFHRCSFRVDLLSQLLCFVRRSGFEQILCFNRPNFSESPQEPRFVRLETSPDKCMYQLVRQRAANNSSSQNKHIHVIMFDTLMC